MLQTMKQKLIGAGVVAVLLCGGIGIYTYTQYQAEQQALHTIVLQGNIDIRESSLAFRQSNSVSEVLVDEGNRVEAGQVLAKLDSRDIETTIQKIKSQIKAQEYVVQRLQNGNRQEDINQAAARVDAATASASKARQDLDKKQSAFTSSNGKSVSQDVLDDAKQEASLQAAKLEEAQQQYQLMLAGNRSEDIGEAEAQLQVLKDELARQEVLYAQYTLVAPTAGVIRNRLVEVGDLASPQKAAFKMVLDGKKWVRAYVSETDLGKLYEGQNADVYVDSYPNTALKGQIGYISNVAEFTPKTVQTEELRTTLVYEVRIYVNDEQNVLRMGMPATVKINL